MGSPMTSTQFIRLLDNRLNSVEEDIYKDLPSMIPTFYTIKNSDSAWEEFYGIGGVPDIPAFTGTMELLDVAPGFLTRVEAQEFAGALQFQRKLIDDKKYSVLDNQAAGLIKAAGRTKEKYGANIFNYAFSTAFQFMYSEEGVALCSSSHTNKSGASTTYGFDNAGTDALDKTNAAATWLLMRKFRNDIGERIDQSDNYALVVPDALGDTAEEIAGTIKSLDQEEGNINPQYGRYKVIRYQRLDDTDSNNWFMVNLDLMKDSLMWVERIKPETGTWLEKMPMLYMHYLYMRFGYGFKDWRWVYGHEVS